jgi:hypothetical protein
MMQSRSCGVVQNRPLALHEITSEGYANSGRKLRDGLRQPRHPLPHYRVDGTILVRRSECDLWIAAYRRVGDTEVDQIVDDVLAKLD